MADKPKGEKRFDIEEDLSKAEIPDILPVLPLRGIVIFPSQIHPFLVSRPLVAQTDRRMRTGQQASSHWPRRKIPKTRSPRPKDCFRSGTAVRILKMLRYPDQSVRVLVQGLARIELLAIHAARAVFHRACGTRQAEPVAPTRKSTRCRRISSASFPSSSRWCRICPTSCR